MHWVGVAGILFTIVLIFSATTAIAQTPSLFVATNKNVYYDQERVIVVGKVSDLSDRRPVHIIITSDGEECAKQNTRPLRDGSFVSRPMVIDACGLGEMDVTVSHAGTTTSIFFVVEDRKEVADNSEIRAIRATVSEAQNGVSARLREVLDANLVIPERAADAYRRGAIETSITLQAVELGNIEMASKHRDLALRYFQEVLDLLSSERLSTVSNEALQEQTRVYALAEWFNRVQDLFRQLVDLANKNDVSVEQEFVGRINKALDDARRFINERMVDNASASLTTADGLLEEVRQKLVQQAEGDDDLHALGLAASRLENWANELRHDASGVPRALAQINASFVHLNSAKSSIEEGNYESAKTSLDSTFKKLDEARKILVNAR